jgi:hypothetical protein
MNNTFLAFHVLHNNSWALLVHKIDFLFIYNMARVIIGFEHYQLGIEILYTLVFLKKNWPNDPRFGCTFELKSIKEYLAIEDDMVWENEDFIADFNLFKED